MKLKIITENEKEKFEYEVNEFISSYNIKEIRYQFTAFSDDSGYYGAFIHYEPEDIRELDKETGNVVYVQTPLKK